MEKYPLPVQQALYEFYYGVHSVFYMELDLAGRLLSSQGVLELLGFDPVQAGEVVELKLDFLTGLLDRDQMPLELPFMEMPSGIPTDVQIFEQENRIWILFIGAQERFIQQKSVQQKVNDLSLTFQRQAKILDQYLGKEIAKRLEAGLENITTSGERRNLTMMFADIRGFTAFSEKSLPEEVFEALNIYLGTMIPAVLEEQGVIDKIIGDEVMAIFGMLEDTDGPGLGFMAAIRMLLAIENLNRQREQEGATLLEVGIGIATGPVSLGVLGSVHRKSITVIGNHVNLASRLQSLAGPGQLIIDSSTYASMGNFKQYFLHKCVELKGYSSRVDVYYLALEQIPELNKKMQFS